MKIRLWLFNEIISSFNTDAGGRSSSWQFNQSVID